MFGRGANISGSSLILLCLEEMPDEKLEAMIIYDLDGFFSSAY